MEEEAWNAYPYTKTRYTCPLVEKFFIEIETRYFNDDGSQDNVFGLSKSELRNRIVGKSEFSTISVISPIRHANDEVSQENIMLCSAFAIVTSSN